MLLESFLLQANFLHVTRTRYISGTNNHTAPFRVVFLSRENPLLETVGGTISIRCLFLTNQQFTLTNNMSVCLNRFSIFHNKKEKEDSS